MASRTEPVGGEGEGGRAPSLLVALDRADELPLHEQIERALREHIRSGRLGADTRLPSTRALARELGVSRGVVTEAYGQLAAEGYLTISQGAPVRVARAVRTASPRVPARSLLPAFAYN
ncbi:MAG TPA: winged helix-turn-helix domain-containing protein, partial [Solirubrobacteraceae bacterium]|nr:winged helix-turn-helix domain-containing protein [Solirubrobacteraceae bacterium]